MQNPKMLNDNLIEEWSDGPSALMYNTQVKGLDTRMIIKVLSVQAGTVE